MKIYGLKIFAITCFILLTTTVFSQIASCNAAQNACSTPGFSLTSNSGNGLPPGLNISNPTTNPAGVNSGCLLSNAPGPNWMVITIGSSGMLGFSFGASGSQFPQTGFYDWAMWAYNPTTCANIFNNTLAPAACCWNGTSTGGTGMGAPPAGGSQSNFQPSIPVTAGQQYIILLSNYSGVTTSVSIANNGSAGLTCSPLILPSFIRCPNQQAVMTATWAANVTNVSYTMASAMPLNANTYTIQTSPTFVVAPPATQVYTVFASGSNSLSAVVTTSNTFTVTISPTTTLGVSGGANENPINVCYGTSALINGDAGGTNYTLTSPPPSAPVVSALHIIQTPTLSTSGTYTMATTLFSGCTATGAVMVNVAPNSTITVNPPLYVCLNGTANLTAALPTATAYSWTGPNSYASNAQNPVINTIQLSAGGIYTVSANINFNGITCLRTATTQIHVMQTSSVTISASPSQTLCQGSALSLGANITGTANFVWAGPNNFNISAQTTTVSNLMAANAGIYTITAIFSNAVLSCPRTNTINISVIATAVPTISIPNNICQYGTAQLSATVFGTPSSMTWIGPNFNTSTLTPVISNIQPASSGAYNFYTYYTLGNVSCPTHTTANINVVAVNNVSVTPAIPACQPDNVSLFSSATNAVSYSWTGPNNFTAYQANPILFHPLPAASGVYTVQASFSSNGLTCYNSNTVLVTVNAALIFTLVPHQGRCEGSDFTIPGPAGATSYSWTSSSGMTSNQQNLFIPTLSPADEGTYNLSVSLGPCVTTQTSSLDVYKHIQQIFFQQSATICKGESIDLKSDVIGSTENINYTWNPPTYLNSPNIAVQTGVKPLGTTIYNVTAFDINCPDYKVSHSFTVSVLQAAKPDLQLEKTQGCQPLCLFYDSRVQRSNSIITYDFIGNNGWSRRFQTDSFSYCLENAGSYTLRIKSTTLFPESEKVCSDSTDYPAPIIVSPKSESEISWLPESPTISENNVTFMASSKNGTIEKRQWVFSGTSNDTLDTQYPQRTFEYTGRYPIMLITTTDLGCTDTVIKFLDIKDDFNVFIPNSFTPNGDNLNDIFQMKGTGIKQELFSMDVFDRWGALLFSTKDPAKGWDGTVKGQQLTEGIYIYKIKLSGANGEGKKEYVGHITLIR